MFNNAAHKDLWCLPGNSITGTWVLLQIQEIRAYWLNKTVITGFF